MGFFKNIINSIVKASHPLFVFESQALKFFLNSDEYYDFPISGYDIKTRHDPFVMEAYTLKNNDLFLEFIKVHSDSTWNGQPRSLYESFIKSELKLKSLEILEREDIGNYEFTTYRVNNSFILHMIYIWEVNKDIFILDTKGKLFSSILSQLKENYTYSYENDEKGEINFDISLVKNNAFHNYFNHDGG